MIYLNSIKLKKFLRMALAEDIGGFDITTDSIISRHKLVSAVIIAKDNCVVCGLDIVRLVLKQQDKGIKFKPLSRDGDLVRKGKIIARIYGKAQSILIAERVALNSLGLLSGIATKTKKFVNAIKPYKTKIFDTRKTFPGLRELQKYAVRVGGGFNHRLRLDEMVMIKDNHLQAISLQSSFLGLKKITEKVRKKIPKATKIEIEVENLREFKEVLNLRPDIIMLDNMSVKDMKKAVQIRNNRTPKLEASGGITLKNIKKVAATGVDMISVGALTHSVGTVDLSLKIIS